MSVFALNLFDLAANDDYREYSRGSRAAVEKHGGRVVALGKAAPPHPDAGDAEPCQAMIGVEWPTHEAFDAFLADPENEPLHALRENGTENYLWWLYDRLDDLRSLLDR